MSNYCSEMRHPFLNEVEICEGDVVAVILWVKLVIKGVPYHPGMLSFSSRSVDEYLTVGYCTSQQQTKAYFTLNCLLKMKIIYM